MRTRRISQRIIIPAAVGLAGTVILIVALPSWLLFSLLGAGLVCTAYVVYQHGM
jgi:hypothetical protein